MKKYEDCWVCYAVWIPIAALGVLWLYMVGKWVWEFLPYALALVGATTR